VQQLDASLDRLIQPPTLLLNFLQNEWASLCDVVVRREVAESVAGYEASFRGLYEDQVFHTKLCLRVPSFVSSSCGYRYRQHPNACTARAHQAGQWRLARQIFLQWLAGYCTEQGFKSPEIWRVLRQEIKRVRHPFWARNSDRLLRLGRRLRAADLIAGISSLAPALKRLRARWQGHAERPPVGGVTFGGLRRVRPISRQFGFDRGLPIDRYYIENFLSAHASDIRGHVLEIGEDTYTRRFGKERVSSADVLHVAGGNPATTIVGDLSSADHIPSDAFDCIILTQTLQLIYDVRAAMRTLYRILKPTGVVLATFPGITQIPRSEPWSASWYWSFTEPSALRLFSEVFSEAQVEVQGYGNVLSAACFLFGLATQELQREELDYRDADYDLVITVRATKAEAQA
jgi:SAM-dependent methyltransferase